MHVLKLAVLLVGIVLTAFAISQGVSRWIAYPCSIFWLAVALIFPVQKENNATTWGSDNRSDLAKKIDER